MRPRGRTGAAMFLALAGVAAAGVRINEFSAQNSSRILRRDANGFFQVGVGLPWMHPAYGDTNWSWGQGPFGYGTNYATDLDSTMRGVAWSLYLRYAFTTDAAVAQSGGAVQFKATFNPGFAAYLNGREVLRKNLGPAGAFVAYDQPAACTNWVNGTNGTWTLGVASNLLVSGANVLAIHLCNDQIGASAFGLSPELSVTGLVSATLVQPHHSARYFPGFYEPAGGLVADLPTAPGTGREWTYTSHDDSAWTRGPGGFGFGYGGLGTDVSAAMRNQASTLYLRRSFVVSPALAANTNALRFVVDYDDGYVAYLNGREIRRANLGAAGSYVPFDATATAARTAGTRITNTLASAASLLVPGTNTLAVLSANVSLADADLAIHAGLQIAVTNLWLVQSTDTWAYWVGTEPPVPPPDSDEAMPGADFADWVELYNDGTSAVPIDGWSLTDNPDRPGRFAFPAGTTLPSNGYLLVLCTGTNVADPAGPFWQADFKLDGKGEYLGLFNASGGVVSAFSPAYPEQAFFHSYGWHEESASWRYFTEPSPGAANAGATLTNVVDQPDFDTPAGIYGGTLTVRLSCRTAGASIRYTINGSEPALTNGATYPPAGIPLTTTATIRARAFLGGCIPSETATRSFLVNAPAALQSLPAVFLTGDPAETLFKSNGVTSIVGGYWWTNNIWFPSTLDHYNIPILRGRATERPGSVEFFYPASNEHYRADCGIRVAGSNFQRPRYKLQTLGGAWYSTDSTQKPQFNLYFRSEYGPEPFEFPFTHGLGADTYEVIRLRSGHNDSYNPFIRDEVARRLFDDTGAVSARGILANLFVNGMFRIYYNPAERYSPDFFREKLGGTNDWDIMNHGGLDEGDTVAWNEMLNYAKSVNAGFTNLANYQSMLTRLDPTGLVDYLLVNIYGCTWDWPNNNWYAARERSPQGRWRFHIWDAEGFMSGTSPKSNGYDMITYDILKSSYTNTYGSCILYSRLRYSPEFRQLFADRVHRHFFNGGALTGTNVLARIFELKGELDPVMQYVRATTVNVTAMTNWVAVRPGYLFKHLRNHGLWPENGPPLFAHPGGPVTNGFSVEIVNTNEAGQVYYALDGADPRAPGGGIAGTLYTGPFALDRSRHVKARAFDGAEWSALSEATYLSDLPALVVTEMMYNPDGTPPIEFIELFNAGTEAIDLSEIALTRGVTFHFAAGAVTNLAAGAYVLVVQNLAAFAARYDTNGLAIAGTYSGQLSNNGEGVEISHTYFGALHSFEYSDGWYNLTDGEGFALAIRDPSQPPSAWNEKEGWRASSVYGGSPGAADPGLVPPPGTVVINEALTHTDASPDGDWIELHNTSTGTVSIGGWYLSDSPDNPYRFRIPDGASIEADGFAVFNSSNHFAAAGTTNDFGFSEYGECVVLSSGLDASNRPTGYRTTQDFGAIEREVTFGRHVRCDGGSDFVAQRAATRGAPNAGPLVGPLVAVEILYRQASNGVEFAEFYNCTTSPVPLWDPGAPSRTWQVTNAVAYSFPAGTSIAPLSSFAVCSTSPAVFRSLHGLSTNYPVFGPWTGILDNAGERLELARPLPVDLTNSPYMIAESVNYNDKAPWPVLAADGWSIAKIRPGLYGNDAFHWQAGRLAGAPGPMPCADTDGDGLPDAWEAANAMDVADPSDAAGDADADRRPASSEFLEGTPPRTPDPGFVLSLAWSNGQPAVIFSGRLAEGAGYDIYDRHYALESLTNLLDGNWTTVGSCSNVVGNNQPVTWLPPPPSTNVPISVRGRVWLEEKP